MKQVLKDQGLRGPRCNVCMRNPAKVMWGPVDVCPQCYGKLKNDRERRLKRATRHFYGFVKLFGVA